MVNHITDKGFIDLEIRFFPSDERVDGYPVEITLGGQQEFRGQLRADVSPWMSADDPVEDGQKLFEALFEDKILQQAWAEARGQSSHRRIRLRIDTNAPELHALPWELLHEGETMLSANADTPFSRYLAVPEPWGGAVEEHLIRVLAVVSNPKDLEDTYNLAPLDMDVERAILEKALFTLDEDDIELHFLDPPMTLERIEETLQTGYHVLHYVGHGTFNKRRGQAALYLQDEEGDAEIVRDEALIKMLARQSQSKRTRLVFLAACQNAARSTANAFLGLGPKLVAAGVPAVVAMQHHVGIKTVRKLTCSFYRSLTEHGIVDCALNKARSTLLTAGKPEPALPVLFMRLRSGQLWETEAKVQTEADFPPPPEPKRPPEITDFVGQEAQLTTLAEKLAESNMVIITGMPGMGKTGIASVLARRVSTPEKTFWHTFADNESFAEVLWKLAGFLAWNGQTRLWRILQSAQSSGQLPPPAVLFDYLCQMLCGHEYLLCFDDFHFVDDDPLLNDFLEQLRPALRIGDIAVIITSQRRPSFAQSDEIHVLAGLSLEDTIELFLHHGFSVPRLQEQQSRIYRTQSLSKIQSLTSTDFVVNLHTRTGGNIHLLTLAANTLKHTSDFVRVLLGLSENDDTERFLIKEIDDSLTEDERAVMRAVAVLMGHPGTRDAIEAILDGENVRRTLSDLSQRHLLSVSDGQAGREYSMNTVVRHFYYNSLSKRERRTMHRRAADYYETEEPDESKTARHLEQAGKRKQASQQATIQTLLNRNVKSG